MPFQHIVVDMLGLHLVMVVLHIVADTLGLHLVMVVSAASADDGTFAPGVPGRLTAAHRGRLGLVWADGTHHNHHLSRRLTKSKAGCKIEVVSRTAGSKGFILVHHRRVVTRTIAWPGRYRRNTRDHRWHAHTGESMIRSSSFHRMPRLLKLDQSRKPVPIEYRELQASITG